MGICRLGDTDHSVFDVDHVELKYRLWMQGSIWDDTDCGHIIHDFLACLYQYRDGHGTHAGSGDHSAVCELWRVVGCSHDDLYRPFGQCQYEKVYD